MDRPKNRISLIVGIITLLAFASFAFAASGSSAPSTAAPGSNVSMLWFNMSNSFTTANNFTWIEIDNTGTASIGNITFIRLLNSTDDTVINSTNTTDLTFPINLTLDPQITITTESNFTVQFELASTATDGETIQANVTAIGNETNVTRSATPFSSSTTTIDAAGPTISYVNPTPANDSSNSETFIEFNVTASGGLDTITLFIYNNTSLVDSNTSTSSPFFWNKTGLAEAVYTINATANDTLGNENTSLPSRTVTLDTTAPTISFSLDDTSVTKGTTITATCTGSDNLDSNPSESFTVNPSTSSAGTFTTSCTVTDDAGNSVSQSISYTVSSSSSGSSTPSDPRRIHTFPTALADTPLEFKVSNDDIDVTEITIVLIEDGENVKITVTQLDGRPSSIDEDPSAEVFGFLEIKTDNLLNSNLKSATIEFEITKSWLSTNNIEKNEVVLFRYDNGWSGLETELVSETSTKITYRATTPGFSYFAIGHQEAETVEETEKESGVETTETPGESDSSVIWYVLGGIGLILLIVVLVGFFTSGRFHDYLTKRAEIKKNSFYRRRP